MQSLSRLLPSFLAFATLQFPSTAPASEAGAVPLLPRDCESALALAAAPEPLRADATVWAWGESGYQRLREGSNGFTCIVNRDWPLSLKPTCFDREGDATIVPKILAWGEMLAAGRPLPEIRAEIAARFERGELISPRRPGVAYMLSGFNRPYDPQRGSLGSFPPHVMFYAPDLTPEDIGFRPEAMRRNPRLPFIAYPGPQGYMIVVTGAGEADLSAPAACGDRLGEPYRE